MHYIDTASTNIETKGLNISKAMKVIENRKLWQGFIELMMGNWRKEKECQRSCLQMVYVFSPCFDLSEGGGKIRILRELQLLIEL